MEKKIGIFLVAALLSVSCGCAGRTGVYYNYPYDEDYYYGYPYSRDYYAPYRPYYHEEERGGHEEHERMERGEGFRERGGDGGRGEHEEREERGGERR